MEFIQVIPEARQKEASAFVYIGFFCTYMEIHHQSME